MDTDTLVFIGFLLVIGAALGIFVDSLTKGMYVPRHWHMILFPSVSFLIGLHIWEKYKNDLGAFLIMLAFIRAGLLHADYCNQAGILYQEYDIEINTPDPKPMIEAEVKPRKIVDLAEKDNVWQSDSIATNLLQKDKRWQTFGVAVVNNRPMTQASWTGRGRYFSKTEFVKQMNAWLTDGVIVPKKGKGNSGYRPNGAGGWQYFKSLADGRKFIPLPMKES